MIMQVELIGTEIANQLTGKGHNCSESMATITALENMMSKSNLTLDCQNSLRNLTK